ncbi:ABC transporter substrate-binding protein [Hymenobacter sp. GOD-10R]|uniref:ABC transporter substrate-binding protein n=1 Tax=Hymenobacter sp. GOD-10R TaxID=3093922 RepID=UPI002D76DA6D|nr:ABC transporter substrate-binding protein [Hymenobacter sp. GOD-10R]WRQ29571.1 ABC transporter substrate-binding protein [Hymenobacter sp. GOD-10R]
MANIYANEGLNLLHTCLLTFDNAEGRIEPWLASRAPVVRYQDSLMLLTYHLRKAATWDNGQPVQARDVAFTLKVMNCPGLPNEGAKARFDFIQDIQFDPRDSRAFTLVCKGRSPDYIRESGNFFILPEYALDKTGSLRSISLAYLQNSASTTLEQDSVLTAFANRYQAADLAHHPEQLPGCGPYQLEKWQTGQFLRFRRKSNWWANRLRPLPSQLEARPLAIDYQIIPNQGTALLALRQGDIDIYPLVPAKDFNNLRASASAQQKLNFYTHPSYEIVTLGFNTKQPLLTDNLTRQALSHLLNIPGLIQAMEQGLAERTVGLLSMRSRPYYNDSLPLLSYDASQTVALLQKAGWLRQANGSWLRRTVSGAAQKLALTVSYRANDPLFEQIGLQFQNAAMTIGVPIILKPTESSLLSGRLREGRYDVYIRTLAGNPFIFNFAPVLHSASIGVFNYTRFGTPNSDKLIEAISAEENPKRKVLLLHKFQVLLQQESPLVPLFFLPYRLVASNQIANLQPSGIKPGYEVKAIITQPAHKSQ